jgi:hypothetical protein
MAIFDSAVMPALASSFQMLRMSSTDASDHGARGVHLGGNPAGRFGAGSGRSVDMQPFGCMSASALRSAHLG